MSRTPRIDSAELHKMLKNGVTKKACAEHFGVTAPAISQAIKKLKNYVTNKTAMETAPIIYKENLNTLDQLNKINKDANEILDLVMGWARGDEKCIRVLEGQVKKMVYRDSNTGEDIETDIIKEIKSKDPRELALKAMGEIRSQLKLQLEIYQTLYDVQAAEEFQKEVIAAIGEAAPDVRDRILQKLKENRAIRAAIQQIE